MNVQPRTLNARSRGNHSRSERSVPQRPPPAHRSAQRVSVCSSVRAPMPAAPRHCPHAYSTPRTALAARQRQRMSPAAPPLATPQPQRRNELWQRNASLRRGPASHCALAPRQYIARRREREAVTATGRDLHCMRSRSASAPGSVRLARSLRRACHCRRNPIEDVMPL